jgi:hypothetical protein
MGQLALGLRSLLVRLAIFVVMAALLAWALGGTLFPRPTVVPLATTTVLGTAFQWELHAGEPVPGGQQWQLLRRIDSEMVPVTCAGWWSRPLGPVAIGEDVVIAGMWLGIDGPESPHIPTAQWKTLAITGPESEGGSCHPITLSPAQHADLTQRP